MKLTPWTSAPARPEPSKGTLILPESAQADVQRLVVVLLALPVLAGCLGAEVGPASPALPEPHAPPGPPQLGVPNALPQDVAAAEPNVAVLDRGTVFVTAPVGLTWKPNAVQGAAWLWRSTDGGGSWEVLRSPHLVEPDGALPLGASCSCDADVVTSPDGWTYYSDWWIAGLAAGNYLVERSPDGGRTWMSAPVTIPEPRSVDRQWLVAGDDGLVGVFYSYFGLTGHPAAEDTPVGGQALQAVFSTNHGRTWSPPVRVVPAEPDRSYQIGHPRWVGDDTIVMPYGAVDTSSESFWTAPSKVRVAVSTDRGETWTRRTVAEVPHGFDNLWAVQGDVDEAGDLHVAWAARDRPDGEGNTTVRLAASRDLGRTWTDPVALTDGGNHFLPWVSAREEGEVAVGWYGGREAGDPMNASGDARWYAYVAARPGPDAAWNVRRVSDAPAKVGPMCPRGASCPEDRELLDYVSLDHGPFGRLHYAFARSDTVEDVDLRSRVHVALERS